MWFLNQMIMLPVATLFYSLEMFAKTVQGIQEMVSHSMNVMTEEITQLFDNAPSGQSDVPSAVPSDTQGGSAPTTSQTLQQEERHMLDQDLGGHDIKYVRYSIIFTKRDYEATLLEERREPVNYATDGASYGGLKLVEFFRGTFPRPPEWRRETDPYPPGHEHQDRVSIDDIPDEDRKYVTFIYQVEQRLPRTEEDYERRQARALEAISRKLG
jgi:hypothetical protein